jgi:GT2 family glycosyltransferase
MTPNSTAEPVGIRDAEQDHTTASAQTVLVICVKYGSDPETEQYLESLRKLQGQRNLQILVVDNTVGVRWSEPATERNLTVIRLEENLGYFGGARSGLSLYLREHRLPDWVIVSNVDLLIADSQFLDKLAALRARPRLGIVAPSIRSALTGRNQNPFIRTRPSAARMHAYKWMFRSWLVLNVYELATAAFHKLRSASRKRPGASAGSGRHDSGGIIYAPHGSFLIFSSEYFRAGGNLDFPCFLFGEEVYLAETLRKLGLDVVYEPSLEVIHQEHKSTSLVKSHKLARAVASSAAYCADTYFPLE